MTGILAVLNFILGLLEKAVPFFLAYKAGKDKVKTEDLEATVKEGEIRNEIDTKAADLDRAAIIDGLHKLNKDK